MAGRWAVYLAPPRGSVLETLANHWLGRDLQGQPLARPAVPGFSSARLEEVTRAPRHYGFHATLKPPFALAEGTDEGRLRATAADFAAARVPFRAPPLTVAAIGSFLALVPSADAPALGVLAADCVRAFDHLRAPPLPEETAKRRQAALTPRQEAYLERWGYPYVLEEFRFHMTLTGPMPDAEERATLRAALAEMMAPACAEPLTVDAIALYAQAHRAAPFALRETLLFGR